MRPLFDAAVIQIEVTNACTNRCANCTRCVGHHKKPFFMDLGLIEQAIDSLDGFTRTVGIMGGEPTLHPEFEKICELVQRKIPAHRAGLWTSGFKWKEYKPLIKKTFGVVLYNDHSGKEQKHQPILVAIDEVIKDKDLMWRLIRKCWVQEEWSPSITPKGAFFCEVAAALDLLFDGPGGYPIDNNWWRKGVPDFEDQVRRYCPLCSGALPMLRPPRDEAHDLVSKGNLERLVKAGSQKAAQGQVTVFEGTMDEDVQKYVDGWKPWRYLDSEMGRKQDLKWDELFLLKGFRNVRQRYLEWKWSRRHRNATGK